MQVGGIDKGRGGVQVAQAAGYEGPRDHEARHLAVGIGPVPAPPGDLRGMGDHRGTTAELYETVAETIGDHLDFSATTRIEPRVVRGDRPAVGTHAEHARHLAGHGYAGHVTGPARGRRARGDGGRRRPVEIFGFLLDRVRAGPVQRQGDGRLP